MEKEQVLLPGMAEPEPTEKSPLSPREYSEPRSQSAQYLGKGLRERSFCCAYANTNDYYNVHYM